MSLLSRPELQVVYRHACFGVFVGFLFSSFESVLAGLEVPFNAVADYSFGPNSRIWTVEYETPWRFFCGVLETRQKAHELERNLHTLDFRISCRSLEIHCDWIAFHK